MRVLSFERGGAKSVDLFLGVKVRHTHTHTHSNKYFSPFHPLPRCISLSLALHLGPFSLSLSLSLKVLRIFNSWKIFTRGFIFCAFMGVGIPPGKILVLLTGRKPSCNLDREKKFCHDDLLISYKYKYFRWNCSTHFIFW